MHGTTKRSYVTALQISVKRILLARSPYTEESGVGKHLLAIKWGKLTNDELDCLTTIIGSLR